MSDSAISSTSILPTSSSSFNGSTELYCGNMGVMNVNETDAYPEIFWACGRMYESALETLTKTSTVTFSADMSTSSIDRSLLNCGYSSTINASENLKSPIDYWNCGRSYAKEYALSDALSLKPTNLLQYFLFALFFVCIIL